MKLLIFLKISLKSFLQNKKLEDKGVKLRSTALPFLYPIFAQEEKAFAASIADSAIPSAASVIAKTMKT